MHSRPRRLQCLRVWECARKLPVARSAGQSNEDSGHEIASAGGSEREVLLFYLDLYIDFRMSGLSWGPMQESDTQQFCVEMMKRLDIQRRNEQFCDVVLEVGSGDDKARFKAHRIVLCAGSPFFYNTLNCDMKEKKEGVIRLENVSSKAVMEELLEYLYTGHVDVTQRNAFDLLEIADFFVIPSLKAASNTFIAQTLSTSNCLMAYDSAVKYQCTELQMEARNLSVKTL